MVVFNLISIEGGMARYEFYASGNEDMPRYLRFDVENRRAFPEDDLPNHLFGMAGRKIARMLRENGELPERGFSATH